MAGARKTPDSVLYSMWELFNLSGMKENKAAERLGDTETCANIAAIILKARDYDISASEHLEKTLALADWG